MKANTGNRKVVLNTILNQMTPKTVCEFCEHVNCGEIIKEVERYAVESGIKKADMDFTVGVGRQLYINGNYIYTM